MSTHSTKDLPSFQTYRADHQATVADHGWPARAASVLARFGHRDEAVAWLGRLERVTREGPSSGRRTHFVWPAGRGGRRVFFNGNMYLESAGPGVRGEPLG